MPYVSVVIPTYQREEVLCNTVRSLLNQDFPDYEILIIDQTEKHEPHTEEFLRSLPPHVRHIRHFPPSLPSARNRGINEARGEIILNVDDDVIVNRDFVSQHAKYYDDPTVGGVTGRIEQEGRYATKTPSFFKSEFIQWISTQPFRALQEGDAYRAVGCNFSFRKEAAIRAGMFDENFIGTAWGEEYDFSLRLRGDGNRLVYSPKAMVHHLNIRDGGCENRKRFDAGIIYTRFHNLAYLGEKNGCKKITFPYLVWYVYKQVMIKRDYLTWAGMAFFIKGHLHLLRGLWAGYKDGRETRLGPPPYTRT